jgi:V/A-type H+-transporting ATPase subunit E
MEELRSTDILDKEIQSDARKKAERILQNAEAEGQKIEAAVSSRIEAAKKDIEATYAEKLAVFKRNVEAALPLECERYLVDFEGKSVSSAINDYLSSLSQERKILLLKRMITSGKKVLANKCIIAKIYGDEKDLEQIEKLVKDEFGSFLKSLERISFVQSREEAVPFLEVHEGIIATSEDGEVKCRFSFDQLVSELEDKYSYELASTLFGGRLPE